MPDSVRAEMDGFQAEADQWYTAIRNSLTPAQQTKLDALPKPQLAFRRRQSRPATALVHLCTDEFRRASPSEVRTTSEEPAHRVVIIAEGDGNG